MKLAVCVKHTIDESELKIDSSGNPQLEGASTKMGTFDKNAVEEALRIKTAVGGEVVALTVGKAEAKKSLKEALAMGADRGVHVIVDPGLLDPSKTSELLAAAISNTGPYDLVICSEGSSDTYTGLVPPMLAERLGLPFVGYARKLEVSAEGSVRAERSLEDSLESVESPTAAVVSVVSEINEPRYPTLIQIMQASKKPVVDLGGDQLGAAAASAAAGASLPATTVLSLAAQPSHRKHIMIEGSPSEAAGKLLEVLAKEGVLSA